MGLTLTRKQGQSVKVDGQAVITVTRLDMGRVRLTIEAPRQTNIVRTELLEVDDEKNSTSER